MSETPAPPAKKHARPGSQWNSTQRKVQKAFDQPKGFARGCRVTQRTVSTNAKDIAK